jgi:hypothetical protein
MAYHRGPRRDSSLRMLGSHCCRQIISVAGSLPISWVDALHASLTYLLIFGSLFLSIRRFEGDRHC